MDKKHILNEMFPYESEVRRWIRKVSGRNIDESDIIQESYYRVWRQVDSVCVQTPRAYFFQVAKNVYFEYIRREKIVVFSQFNDAGVNALVSNEPDIHREFEGREKLAIVRAIIAELPARCREVITLRKVEGISQRRTAELLGLSENIVEKEVAQALRYLLARMGELEARTGMEAVDVRPIEQHRERR